MPGRNVHKATLLWGLAAVPILLFSYLLSIGPAVLALKHISDADARRVILRFYSPVIRLEQKNEHFARALRAYADLWR